MALDDPHLQEELNKALTAVAGSRDLDKKPVTIVFTGTGDRHVRIGYVVQTPVWKTSYRLLLNDGKGGVPALRPANTVDGALQGWAIVENETDNDWADISAVAGERPADLVRTGFVSTAVSGSTDGRQHAVRQRDSRSWTWAGATEVTNGRLSMRSKSAMPSQQNNFASCGRVTQRETPLADMPIDAGTSVQSQAATSVVGELFQYTVDHVSLPRRQSSMIPIVTDPIEVQRVSIYNQSVLSNHPLNGARITNTTKKHLLAGPVTVLDGGAYAGDAQIDNMPPGQRRLHQLRYRPANADRHEAGHHREPDSIGEDRQRRHDLHAEAGSVARVHRRPTTPSTTKRS